MSNRYSLRISPPDRTVRVVPLRARRTILGRSPDCEVVLEDGCVSRHHVEIEKIGGGRFRLRDLGSLHPPGSASRLSAVVLRGLRPRITSASKDITAH